MRRRNGETRQNLVRETRSHLGKNRSSTSCSAQFFRATSLIMRWRVQSLRQKIFLIIGLGLTLFSLYASFMEIHIPAQPMHPRVIRINAKYKRRMTYAEYDNIEREVEPISIVKVKENNAPSLEIGDCKAMHDWQLLYQPACNNIHEVNMNDNKFLAQGGFRSVWLMSDGAGSEAVIKTLVWHKKFREKEKERHRRDATAYMMLQDSKHIPNIYGYCKCVKQRTNDLRCCSLSAPGCNVYLPLSNPPQLYKSIILRKPSDTSI
jgi:hypothetical protein